MQHEYQDLYGKHMEQLAHNSILSEDVHVYHSSCTHGIPLGHRVHCACSAYQVRSALACGHSNCLRPSQPTSILATV